ncbi:LysR family transcriptional regulator [Scytonema sp. UIC 10036]|uniref:LysR family transcriptional regulator n=1 Tax=Scytonema sp. UIC 10036 TaxID=2304196 RepID=UPI0012DA1E68|nr:LysR family transcriptional regulator [Scytonema sp. UIC 10036]MUG95062.1 LysR family transcriptional regulator [Scytonema sp. UIC 10036]
MELRHLRYFVTVAEELHFGRAAERLQMAQPPLSHQIRQLELELGVELFHRTKRSVQLTEVGQLFLEEARQILIQAGQAVQIVQQASSGEVGRLVLGFVGSATYSILPDTLKLFRKKFPKVLLSLHEMTTAEVVQALHEKRIHLGFVRPPINDEELIIESVFKESFIVALPKSHPLERETKIYLKMLANEPFILFPRHLGSGFYDQIVAMCQKAGFSPQVAQEAVQMQTIVSLVAAELGVAIVPASMQNLQRVGVVYKLLAEETPQAELAMIWRRDEKSPVLHKFLDIVREIDLPCWL